MRLIRCLTVISFITITFLYCFSEYTYAEEAEWKVLPIPRQGEAYGYTLANNCAILQLEHDNELLYCLVRDNDGEYRLLKSGDGGLQWSTLLKEEEKIIGFEVISGGNEIIYATESRLYLYDPSSREIETLFPDGSILLAENEILRCFDCCSDIGDMLRIAVGTVNDDSGKFGDVFLIGERDNWQIERTGIDTLDVLDVHCAQDSEGNEAMIAAGTDETDATIVRVKGGNGEWSDYVADAVVNGIPGSVYLALPDKFASELMEGEASAYMGVAEEGGGGNIYRIEFAPGAGTTGITLLNLVEEFNLDTFTVTGLAMRNGILLAGAENSPYVYYSRNNGDTWHRSRYALIGEYVVETVIAGSDEKEVWYTITGGDDGGLSVSYDGGKTFYQVSLINDHIDTIIDIAVPATFDDNQYLYMLTMGTGDSIWQTDSKGTQWQRLTTAELLGTGNIETMLPDYTHSESLIYLNGLANGVEGVWRLQEPFRNVVRLSCGDENTGRLVDITTMTLTEEGDLFVSGYNGEKGMMCFLQNKGTFTQYTGTIGDVLPSDCAISPDFDKDGELLVGTENGMVYWSKDAGRSFSQVTGGSGVSPLTGKVYVAFHPDYRDNNLIFAACTGDNGGIYRLKMGSGNEWSKIDATLAEDSVLTALVLSPDGCLYATDKRRVDNEDKIGGIERSLNPEYNLGPKFETVLDGLEEGSLLDGLRVSDDSLFSIDTINTRIMVYKDILTERVLPVLPEDNCDGVNPDSVLLSWNSLDGAERYEWQVSYTGSFSEVDEELQGETEVTVAWLPELSSDAVCSWRVRAVEPVASPWSDTWTFTTALQAGGYPELYYPEAGEIISVYTPAFQWGPVRGADSYEFLLAENNTFTRLVEDCTGEDSISGTAYQCKTPLDEATTYFWKVRAVNEKTASEWSNVSVFSTEHRVVATVDEVAEKVLKENSGADTSEIDIEGNSAEPDSSELLQERISATDSIPSWAQWLYYLGAFIVLLLIAILLILLVLLVRALRY